MKKTLSFRFLIVWAGQLVSGLGTGMTGFALGVHVFRETQSATGFAMVILALFVPAILLRPVGGVLADRFDRRSLIVFGDIGSAAAVVSILLSLYRGDWTLTQIYLGVAVSSACTALQNPAYKASVSDLVSEEGFAQAGGLMQLAASAQHLLAPLAAGLMLSTAGIEAVLLVDIATFLVAVVAVLSIPGEVEPTRRVAPARMVPELKAGAAALLADRAVLDTVLVISLVTFFVGLLQTLFGPMMLSFTDSRTLGLVQSVSATGMLLSSVAVGVIGVPVQSRKVIPVALALAGFFLTLMTLSTNLIAITASFFLFFVSLPLINSSAEVQIRTRIPNEMQGRTWGIIGLLTQIGYIIAYLSGGVLADYVFTPLLLPSGALANSAGRIIGTGPGRGIALLLCCAGFGLSLTGVFKIHRDRRNAGLSEPKGAYQS
jgi:MFS transporter, DHA3 family, macrolide efflux protein